MDPLRLFALVHPTIQEFALCELICFVRKHYLRQQPATNQPVGQITKSCPASRAKIFRFPYPPNQRLFTRRPDPARGADRASSRTRDGMRWTQQRQARSSDCTCMLVCASHPTLAHETAGASRHPAFPAPSRLRDKEFQQSSDAICVARMRTRISVTAERGTL